MKKISILLALFVMGTVMVQAQDNQRPNRAQRAEQLESMKVAFITKELNLTTEEAERFWPIYNDHQASRKQLKEDYKGFRQIDTMSDKEVEVALDKMIELEQRQLDLKKEYINRMRQVIPTRKIAKLQKIEREFKAKVLKELDRRKRQGQGQRQGGQRGNGRE